MTQINYKEFIKYVHQKFEQTTNIEDIKDLLYLKEGYNKDNPSSLGKSILLKRLVFSGKKLSGDEFKYDHRFYEGINAWIADNHKGKSTIFKIIKLALTGNDSIKRDIKSWIKEIILEFQIGEIIYTCFVDRRGRDRGALYRFNIDTYFELKKNEKLESIDKNTEFEFKNSTQFEEKMQEFFFDQFSFYTLKYTQHGSAKDDFELKTANLSWSTYFKSIYLESSDYEYLFFEGEKYGSQGRRIFEMILGLPLTYPINMLNLQQDRIIEKIGNINQIQKSKKSISENAHKVISSRYLELKTILEETKKIVLIDDSELINRYNTIQENIRRVQENQRLINKEYQEEINKRAPLEQELFNLDNDKKYIEAEIVKLSRQEINLDIYKQSDSFFSNLEIKTCPHCEIGISAFKKEKEKENHTCSLCGEVSTESKTDVNELESRLNSIRIDKAEYETKLKQIVLDIEKQSYNLKSLKESVLKYNSNLISIPNIETEIDKLRKIENQLEANNIERTKKVNLLNQQEDLIKEEAILKYRLELIENEKEDDNNKELEQLNLKKEIIEFALNALEKKRIVLNKDILDKLQGLILNEVNTFGLTSIQKVEINNKYDLIFTQNNVPVYFKELTEGEKLRTKLAFYLSLIQLDIEYSLGRHPRFLIFDSPGSEEMVPKHLQGLSDILKNVNLRFHDHLQIFVGSALRDFSEITEKHKTTIKLDDEFVF